MTNTAATTTAARTERLEFTTSAFERSHGRRPSGHGMWAFQRTTTGMAFELDRFGETLFLEGTLTQAKRTMRELGHTGLWAVMP